MRTLSAVAPAPLLDLCPNPAPDSPLLAVVSPSAPLTIFNLETSSVHSTFPASPDGAPTAACWSVKGKQLAVGTASGTILQYTPEGDQKARLARPADLALEPGAPPFEVRALEWLENLVFLATYARARRADDPQHEDELFVLTRGGGGGGGDAAVHEVKFADPVPPFGMMGRQGRRWVGRFKNWCAPSSLLSMRSTVHALI